MCKPVDGISHSNSCFDAKSITSISATSRWKIPWGEQFKLFYTDKQILREFVTFAPQTPQMCLIEFLKPIHNYECVRNGQRPLFFNFHSLKLEQKSTEAENNSLLKKK